MTIDIDGLTEAELVDLNRRVVERLRFLQRMRAHRRTLEFGIGDRVAFQADGHGAVEGMLTRHNGKSVTAITVSAALRPTFRRGERVCCFGSERRASSWRYGRC